MTSSGASRARRRRSRRLRGNRRRGAALVLTLLVLAILIVITVQFAYAVKTEELVVENQKDDAELKLAARGVIYYLDALFKDDLKNGKTPPKTDTLADVWSDPKAPETRKLKLGEVDLELEIEDLDRRLSLQWLAEDDRCAFTMKALERLMKKCKVESTDLPALVKKISDFVRKLAGKQPFDPNTAATPAPAPTPGPNGLAATAPAKRAIFDIDQLLEVEGLDAKVLFGDPEAKPEPTTGIARFLTTWPTGTLNLNTMSGEVLYATLPEKNADGTSLWEPDDTANAVVTAIRKKRIDPELQTEPPPDPSGGTQPPPVPPPPPGQGQGVSKSWAGAAFEDVEKLQDASIHQLLGSIFSKAVATGNGNGATNPPANGGTTPAPTTTTSQGFDLRKALAVTSSFYAVKITASKTVEDAKVQAVMRLVLVRKDADLAPLLFREDEP